MAQRHIDKLLAATISCVTASCVTLNRGAPPNAPVHTVAAIPHTVTADIQSGIEAHIERQVASGGGYFNLPYDGRTLRMHLVRVHTEYLATLGPRSHFACVDLVDVDGDVFDVDFFISGDPGAMIVTETTVHKKNGQPRRSTLTKSLKCVFACAAAKRPSTRSRGPIQRNT